MTEEGFGFPTQVAKILLLQFVRLWFLDVVKCGARSAERGTASLRVATFTRNNFSFFIFTCVKPLIDFGFWMKYEEKANFRKVAVVNLAFDKVIRQKTLLFSLWFPLAFPRPL